MNPTTQDFGPCPCREPTYESVTGPRSITACLQEGTKLTKYGHLVGCTCRPCLGRRNRRKGQKSEAKVFRALGGEGQTIRDDLMFTRSLDIAYENKTGKQVPASIRAFVESKWFRDALRQAEKKKPVGADCQLAVTLDMGRLGQWAIVDIRGREKP